MCNYSIHSCQLLSAAGKLSDKLDEEIWEFFTGQVVATVNTYQAHAIQTQQQLCKEDIEQLLCEGVEDIQTCTV